MTALSGRMAAGVHRSRTTPSCCVCVWFCVRLYICLSCFSVCQTVCKLRIHLPLPHRLPSETSVCPRTSPSAHPNRCSRNFGWLLQNITFKAVRNRISTHILPVNLDLSDSVCPRTNALPPPLGVAICSPIQCGNTYGEDRRCQNEAVQRLLPYLLPLHHVSLGRRH